MNFGLILAVDGIFVGYLLAFGAAALACLFGTLRAMQIEHDDVRRGLASLLILSAGWAASQVGALLAPVLWAKAFYIAGLVVGFATVFAWLWFCSAYTGRAVHRHPVVQRVALVILVVVTVTKVTNPWHGLYFTTEVASAPFYHFTFEHGLMYWVSLGLAYALATAGYFMLLELFVGVRQGGGALALLAGLTALPAALNIVGYATPWLVDLAHEPLGVAAFAIGVLFLYRGTFETVRLVGDREAPTLVLDEEGRLRDWGEKAARLFPALQAAGGTGKPLKEVLPELGEVEAGGPSTIEISGESGPRYYRVDVRPFGIGSAHFGRLLVMTDVTEKEKRRQALEEETAALRTFTRIAADRKALFEEKVRRLLELGREYLSMPHGFLIRSGEDTQRVVCAVGNHPRIEPGKTASLSNAYCHEAAEGLLAISDVASSEREEALTYKRFGFGAYIGASVSVRGEPYGIFCFSSPNAREDPFTERDEVFLELLSRWASHELERSWAQRRLKRQNERLDRFAGVLSHDLRNPLNVAMGRLELTREARGESGDPKGHLAAVHRALGRMNQIIEDTLKLAWSGQELEMEDREDCNLEEVVREAWQQVETGSAILQVEVSRRLQANEIRLRRVLENLFRNAIEHGGEEVTVTVGALEEEAPERGFFVEDDGPGIPEGKREEVFEAGISSREEGTGLGLSIVRSIAEAHGWVVSVTEGRKGGARFEVRAVETLGEATR